MPVDGKSTTITVSDMAGRVVLERNVTGSVGEISLSTEGWASGTYGNLPAP